MVNGWTSPLGWLPALNDLKRPSPSRLRIASAMMERAELPVQRNSTFNRRSVMLMSFQAARQASSSSASGWQSRSEEHTSELQSLMRISYAVFCLKKKKIHETQKNT